VVESAGALTVSERAAAGSAKPLLRMCAVGAANFLVSNFGIQFLSFAERQAAQLRCALPTNSAGGQVGLGVKPRPMLRLENHYAIKLWSIQKENGAGFELPPRPPGIEL
jgi:hypothetical protein